MEHNDKDHKRQGGKGSAADKCERLSSPIHVGTVPAILLLTRCLIILTNEQKLKPKKAKCAHRYSSLGNMLLRFGSAPARPELVIFLEYNIGYMRQKGNLVQ